MSGLRPDSTVLGNTVPDDTVPDNTPAGNTALANTAAGNSVPRARPVPAACDRPFWDELCHAIIAYGGSLAGFLDRLSKRLFDYDLSDDADPTRPTAPPRPSALATGPP